MFNTVKEKGFKKQDVCEMYKNKYHNYHVGKYDTEHIKSMGIFGDNPLEKFSQNPQNNQTEKVFNDNFPLSLGTSKASSYIPGYSGYLPINQIKNAPKDTLASDPYFKEQRSNHILNYKTRLPGYKGYIPFNANNIKGNIRPYCLSTDSEAFS